MELLLLHKNRLLKYKACTIIRVPPTRDGLAGLMTGWFVFFDQAFYMLDIKSQLMVFHHLRRTGHL
jgi:hypothetical protein